MKEIIPYEQELYLDFYGPHFSKKVFDYAVSEMRRRSSNGKTERIVPISKQQVEEKLKVNGITLENNKGYDAAFVYNMALADFFGSSIMDERHLCLYVKDYIDDPDAIEGTPFYRWLSTQKVDFADFI